jgi:dolichyl-phosphate-mannose--protein O-mannosyl transferase
MFLFYATPLIPFMVLAVVLVLGYLIGPAPAGAAGAHAALPGEASPGRTGLGETGPGETGRGGEGYPLPGEPYRDAGPHGGGGAHATPAPVQGAVQGAGMRRLVGSAAAGAFLLVVLANFAYFYPILAAQTLPYDEWHARIWFQSWV